MRGAIWTSCFLGAVSIALQAISFLDFQPKRILLGKGELLEQNSYLVAFYVHIIFGSVALVVGPIQFLPWIRERWLSWHRGCGALYVLSCLLSGVSGFYIAFYAEEGPATAFGFGTLASLWLSCTVLASQSVRTKQFAAHRAWMLRSYALTFAAVTLRTWLPLLTAGWEMSFEAAYPIVSWLAWVPNLLAMEGYIRVSRSRQ
ncbi:MAG: DUF2306 domain-containing protein [Saccharospirillaceae bacterium]|nr:DUF2306 domain-containing protein [Saccharospirillaceae bacterium]